MSGNCFCGFYYHHRYFIRRVYDIILLYNFKVIVTFVNYEYPISRNRGKKIFLSGRLSDSPQLNSSVLVTLLNEKIKVRLMNETSYDRLGNLIYCTSNCVCFNPPIYLNKQYAFSFIFLSEYICGLYQNSTSSDLKISINVKIVI